MPDVLQLALDRRRQLTEEVDKIDEFIRTAESLLRHARFQTLLAQRASNEAGDLRTALARMNSEKEPAVGVQAAISKNGARASSS